MQAARLIASTLACRRGERLLFAGLSLALGPGEACRVAGANGIGKSSLIRILAGLAPAYAGAVEREGAVGLIDERLALDPGLPLGAALAFWAQIDGVDGGTLAANLAALGLRELTDVPVRYLSTGQKKRAGLLVIPLAVPVLIFGAGSLAAGGESGIALAAAASLVLVALAPFAGGAAVRAGR